jgi:hypothetical protein
MTLLSDAAAVLGRKGGKSKSPAKLAAVRRNGKLGGRPRKPAKDLTPSGLWRRRKRDMQK